MMDPGTLTKYPYRPVAGEVQTAAYPVSLQPQAAQVAPTSPAIVVGQAPPEQISMARNLPRHIRTATEIVKAVKPEDVPQFPSVVFAVDSFVSRLPWWVTLAFGGVVGYWFGRGRRRE